MKRHTDRSPEVGPKSETEITRDSPEMSMTRALSGCSDVRTEINRECLRAAVMQQICCMMARCGRVLDVRTAVLWTLEAHTLGTRVGRRTAVVCGECGTAEGLQEFLDAARAGLVARYRVVDTLDALRQLELSGVVDERPGACLLFVEIIRGQDLYPIKLKSPPRRGPRKRAASSID